MSLTTGTRLGSYEVLAKLGEGGMGEVYRARDTRLKRDVAIKVLPDGFATDPDRLARFHREAELLASLNHPNIASIYGIEEVRSGGSSASATATADRLDPPTTAIVLELINGDTLADLIARGPLLMTAALPIARQVAEALEAAHEKGVIHRDLKPANIKVTPDGNVKVLDFGLATVVERSTPQNINVTHSPTLTLATQAGVILGTAAYMSPEQASGAMADKRSDVWAFGVVLWEMLTGKRLFDGETVSHTLAYVLTKEPDWTALPPNTPPSIRRLLRRSLEKERKRRLPDIASARLEIDDVTTASVSDVGAPSVPAPAPPRRRLALPWAIAGAAIAALGVTLAVWSPWRTAAPAIPVRLNSEIGADASVATVGTPSANIAISPDGKLLAFVGRKTSGGSPLLFVRRLDQLAATPLSGGDNASNPFFSPDGNWIGFFADGKLKKISTTGGASVTLCDAPNGRGGSWGEDGTIAFVPSSTPDVSLLRVSSAGGHPETLTKLDPGESLHRWPQLLKGGNVVLFSAAANAGAFNDATIVAQTVPEGTRKIVLRGGYYARYVPSGHLIYMHSGTVFAASFDLDRLEITGQPIPVLEGVAASVGTGGVQLAVSDNGTLVYLPGVDSSSEAPMAWMDRAGTLMPMRSVPSDWSNPQFSADGSRLAIDLISGGSPDVWIYEWARDTLTRLTFDPAADAKPVWTPDGRRIAFTSTRAGGSAQNLYWQRADNTGEVQRLTESANNQLPGSFHPSGKFLAFAETNSKTGADIMILPLEGDETTGWKAGKPTVFQGSPFGELEPMFSPDGRWIAYTSTATGQAEVYVRPFPGPGGLQQISTEGGTYPMWSRSKPELFYVNFQLMQIMVASYTAAGDSFRVDKQPRPWSPASFAPRTRLRPTDVHPDGLRAVVAPIPDAQAVGKQDKLVFVFNFFDELKRIAPAK